MVDKPFETRDVVIDALFGKPCWYVSCGGAAGPTFQLAIGGKIPRQCPLRNDAHSEEYRQFEGEANLLVWCTWRLDDARGPVTSSDDSDKGIDSGLNRLVGAAITDAAIDLPGWDLQVGFSNGLRLRVFCDHVPGDPSFDGNWELWLPDRVISVGVGSVCDVESRLSASPSV
jgi:hypothetical protein